VNLGDVITFTCTAILATYVAVKFFNALERLGSFLDTTADRTLAGLEEAVKKRLEEKEREEKKKK